MSLPTKEELENQIRQLVIQQQTDPGSVSRAEFMELWRAYQNKEYQTSTTIFSPIREDLRKDDAWVQSKAFGIAANASDEDTFTVDDWDLASRRDFVVTTFYMFGSINKAFLSGGTWDCVLVRAYTKSSMLPTSWAYFYEHQFKTYSYNTATQWCISHCERILPVRIGHDEKLYLKVWNYGSDTAPLTVDIGGYLVGSPIQ